MRYVVDNTYLQQRGRVWWYFRRVPSKFAHLDTRGTIRQTLETASVDEARFRRDALADADELYWNSLWLAEEAGGAEGREQVEAARKRHASACKRSLASGFKYLPVEELSQPANIEDTFDRLLEVRDRSHNDGAPKPNVVEALLGGAPEPDETSIKVSEAFKVYVDEIAFDEQKNKSRKQRYSWEKTKRTSVNYFIDTVGDVGMGEITREMALSYRSWWIERMIPGDGDTKPAKANTANRHIGNMRKLYEDYYRHVGDEDRLNPFRKMFFKDEQESRVPSFEDDFVRTRILVPGLFDGLNDQLKNMIYVLIETGARLSEICNLQPEQIRLEADVPHIEIKAIDRELKTVTSKRQIPLVGVALEAMKRSPKGFPHYVDKGELVSANLMKAFRSRDLFPSPEHVIYSFRHAFEDRMLEAEIDYGLRCYLMGHKNNRPDYGKKGSLEYRRDQLLKISHPFDAKIFNSDV